MTQPAQTPVDRLQSIPFEQLAAEIEQGAHDADLEAVFGATLATDIKKMADQRGAMMDGDQRPLVVMLPGIMGSTLDNTVGQTGRIWLDIPAILRGRLRLLTLNEQAEPLIPSVNIQPADLIASIYLPMRLHLGWFGGCDLHVLPFDWRYQPAASVERLRTLINGLRATDRRRVHLVGHSMGGLVIRAYCARYNDEAARNLAQVIMIGTPNAGSMEAIRNLTVGGDQIQLIRKISFSDDVLDLSRSVPGLYALMPVPQSAYYANGQKSYPFASSFDLFQAENYHILGISAARLAAAAAALSVPPQELPVPTMLINGTGVPTSIGVHVSYAANERPLFDFGTDTTPDGDGTVPLASALALPGAGSRQVWQGRHGDLPLYPNVRRAVLHLLHGDDPRDLPVRFDRGFMDDEPTRKEHQSVPATPLPGALTPAQVDLAAARIQDGTPTAEDIALLTRGW